MKDITKDDIHNKWTLGNFFVSGFTSHTEKNGNIVFLKNVGDVVTLWFKLSQDINALNNDKNLSITADPDRYDHYFQTETTNFGRGMLIIRKTDHENIPHDLIMYKKKRKGDQKMSNQLTDLIDRIIAQDHLPEKENELLTALRAIVSGEKQEYYTDEMFKVFYEHANILSLSPEEASSILAPFYETLNMKNPCNEDC